MKKGVLIVSFGTSYREAEAQNINPVEQAISAALPGYEMRRAYGSRRIIKKLKERDGICIDTVSEALETLAVAGCKELIVQPTYVIHGYEYDELVEILREYLNQFESVRLGHPLLHQQSDYKELICGLNEVFDFRSSSDAFVFMGHGTGHFANACYPALEHQIQAQGFTNVWIGTVEGYPEITDVKEKLEQLSCQKAVLAPLMLVAGDHARNDMAGEDEDSWKNILERDGIEADCMIAGLGSCTTDVCGTCAAGRRNQMIYKSEICIVGCVIPYRTISSVIEEHILIWKKQTKATRNELFAFYCLRFG